jgi:SAM-dependent methyltransferase
MNRKKYRQADQPQGFPMSDPEVTESETGTPGVWDDSRSHNWITLQGPLERMLAPIGEQAIKALAPQKGESFLDVGCGCGHTALALARAVGPDGNVTGVDVSPSMLATGRNHAAEEGLHNLHFVEANAQTRAFTPGKFDGLFSRFGVMFFDDPVAAFTNLGKALKPGGRLAFVCWRDRREVEWFEMPIQVAHANGVPAPDLPGTGPGAFAFANPQRLHKVLGAAGFTDIAVTPLDLSTGGGNSDEVLSILHIGFVGEHIKQFPDKEDVAWAAVRQALEAYTTPDGVFIGTGTWIVTARRTQV